MRQQQRSVRSCIFVGVILVIDLLGLAAIHAQNTVLRSSGFGSGAGSSSNPSNGALKSDVGESLVGGMQGNNVRTEGGFFTMQFSASTVRVALELILEGPYNSGTQLMNTTLRTSGYLAAHFGSLPVPANAVDSIAIELRNNPSAASSTTRKFRPAWLMADGTIRGFPDTALAFVEFDTIPSYYYYASWHRNHLAIMSATGQPFTTSIPTPYDFTTSQSQAYGSNPMKQVGGRYAMIAGDANGNGQVANSDINSVIRPRLGQSGYLNADINLNGQVANSDINSYARPNIGKGSQVPAAPPRGGSKEEKVQ